jgi:predicted MFS family arabinose efflux permease
MNNNIEYSTAYHNTNSLNDNLYEEAELSHHVETKNEMVTIIKNDNNSNLGIGLMFSLFTLYVFILCYYSFKKENVPAPSTKDLTDIFDDFDKIPLKKPFIYILLAIMVAYVCYFMYMVITEHKTNQLKNPRFWEETLLMGFAMSFGLFIPGYYLNKKPMFSFALGTFIFNVVYKVLTEL